MVLCRLVVLAKLLCRPFRVHCVDFSELHKLRCLNSKHSVFWKTLTGGRMPTTYTREIRLFFKTKELITNWRWTCSRKPHPAQISSALSRGKGGGSQITSNAQVCWKKGVRSWNESLIQRHSPSSDTRLSAAFSLSFGGHNVREASNAIAGHPVPAHRETMRRHRDCLNGLKVLWKANLNRRIQPEGPPMKSPRSSGPTCTGTSTSEFSASSFSASKDVVPSSVSSSNVLQHLFREALPMTAPKELLAAIHLLLCATFLPLRFRESEVAGVTFSASRLQARTRQQIVVSVQFEWQSRVAKKMVSNTAAHTFWRSLRDMH